jgi:hypothetical protein
MYLEIIATIQVIISVLILCTVFSLFYEPEIKPIDPQIQKRMYS